MNKVGILGLFLFVSLVSSSFVTGAVSEVTTGWDKTLNLGSSNEIIYSIAIDSNDDVYFAGYFQDSYGSEGWIKKYSSAGVEDTTNWNKIIDLSGSYIVNDIAYAIAVDSNDNVYVAGSSRDAVGYRTSDDWWIKKYSSAGVEDTTNWDISYNSGGSNNDVPYSITIDSNDNVYVVGKGADLDGQHSRIDWWMKKFDSSGNEDTTNWNKGANIGKFSHEIAYDVAVDSNDNVYVVGYAYGQVSSSGPDWWIKKYSSAGVEDNNWNITYDTGGADIAYSVAVDGNDNVYVVGGGSGDWLIKKFDSSGNEDTTNWNITYNSGVGNDDEARSVEIDNDNNVYVSGGVGRSNGKAWHIKVFDSSGNENTVDWDRTYEFSGTSYANLYASAVKGQYMYFAGVSGSNSRIKKFYDDAVSATSAVFVPLKSFNSPTSFSLSPQESAVFLLGEEEHTITADSVLTDSATITVQSDPITFNLQVRERIKLDIDEDGIRDIIVRLKSIDSGIANILVKPTNDRLRAKDAIRLEIQELRSEIKELRAEKKLLKGKENRGERRLVKAQIRELRKEINILRKEKRIL